MRAAKQAVPRHARFGATYVLRAPDGQTGPRVNPAAARLSELPPPPKGSKKPHVSFSSLCPPGTVLRIGTMHVVFHAVWCHSS